MLSVLIATYNYAVLPLVKELHQQLEDTKIPFEIICIDDASASTLNVENKKINTFSYSTFESLPQNIGRSALRNLLATKAQYHWLLFLDADVLPTSNHFIANYLACIKNETQVYCGGIQYRNDTTTHLLRWKFGRSSEEVATQVRNKQPYKHLFTANFLCKKSVFSTVKFSETLTKYGYEDLLFALELKKNDLEIKHIQNPVFHLGIDTNMQFITKTKAALGNLLYLIENNQMTNNDTKVSKLFFMLRKIGLTQVLASFLTFFEERTVKKSSLFYFQLFRLGYLQKLLKRR